MFSRDWIRHPALGVILFAIIGLGPLALKQHQHPSSGGYDGASEHYQSAYNCAVSTSAEREPPVANKNPKRDEWRQEKDLQAQQDMALYALWIATVSSIGVAVTLAGVIYVAKTLNVTRIAAEATAEAAKSSKTAANAALLTAQAYQLSERAWMVFDKIEVDQFFNDEGKVHQFGFRLYWINVGKIPAAECAPAITYYAGKITDAQIAFPHPEVIDSPKGVCGQNKRLGGEPLAIKIDDALAVGENRVRFIIYAYISYQDAFSEGKQRWTETTIEVIRVATREGLEKTQTAQAKFSFRVTGHQNQAT